MNTLKKFNDPFDETEMFTVSSKYVDKDFREKGNTVSKHFVSTKKAFELSYSVQLILL